MHEVAPGIAMIDTRLAEMDGVTAVYLVDGERPALVDTGARTTAQTVRDALAAAGMGADDLAWIVLTHVHLDHCGATGILTRAFPRAQVVVHRRGARHLAEPGRLVAGTAAVHGANWSLYGGLDASAPERITAVEDGHRVPVGPGRELVMRETLGHARHHMSVLDESTGTVIAGDAVGVRFPGGGLYPVLPPPDIDLEAGDRSLALLASLAPALLCLAHFGPSPEVQGEIARAREQLARLGEATRAAVRDGGGGQRIAERVARELPMEAEVGDPEVVARWRRLAWADSNIDGLAGWAERSSG